MNYDFTKYQPHSVDYFWISYPSKSETIKRLGGDIFNRYRPHNSGIFTVLITIPEAGLIGQSVYRASAKNSFNFPVTRVRDN